MSLEKDSTLCAQTIPYVMGQLSESDRLLYEHHLLTCSNCQEEFADLQSVFGVLPYAVPPVELPKNLKERTLQAAFHIRPALADPTSFKWFIKSRYGKIAVNLVAVLLISWVASFWKLYSEPQQEAATLQIFQGTHIQASLALSATKSDQPAAGTAYLASASGKQVMIIQVRHAETLTGNEVYQAWLVKDGHRQSAGTFRVDESGDGLLVFSAKGQIPTFDSIGITREPDTNSTSPRGPKILGTST